MTGYFASLGMGIVMMITVSLDGGSYAEAIQCALLGALLWQSERIVDRLGK